MRRACLLVSPLTCSANVTLAQSGDRHRKPAHRQTNHHLAAADGRVQQPPLIPAVDPAGHRTTPRAPGRRRPRPGQDRTGMPDWETSSTCTFARCGSSTPGASRSHGAPDHRRHNHPKPDTPGWLTETVPEPNSRAVDSAPSWSDDLTERCCSTGVHGQELPHSRMGCVRVSAHLRAHGNGHAWPVRGRPPRLAAAHLSGFWWHVRPGTRQSRELRLWPAMS